MPSPEWLNTQNDLAAVGTREKTVSKKMVSSENVSRSPADVEKESSSVQANIVSNNVAMVPRNVSLCFFIIIYNGRIADLLYFPLPFLPYSGIGVAWHSPVTARTEAHAAYLWSVG